MHMQFIEKEEFLRSFPTLHYGNAENWFVVTTPNNTVCALALQEFPNPQSLLKRYYKHTLVEEEIHLSLDLKFLLVGTPLQYQVWKALREIPTGTTWSYQQLAAHIGKPKAVRAIANAVGANPISPLIPCHRVIRSSGHIGGYYWGTPAKLKLLKEEGVNITHLKTSNAPAPLLG